MNPEQMIRTLHEYERRLLQHVDFNTSFKEMKQCGLEDIQIKRALQWLGNKELVESVRKTYETLNLSDKGFEYKASGLPQTQVMNSLTNEWKSITKDKIHAWRLENRIMLEHRMNYKRNFKSKSSK